MGRPLPVFGAAQIRHIGEKAGIVKIVPPEGYKPSYHPENLRQDNRFPTKRQVRVYVCGFADFRPQEQLMEGECGLPFFFRGG